MTAPEREALVKAREALTHHRQCSIFDMAQQECDCGIGLLLYEIDAVLAAPAVTVTEGRCRAVYREACSGYEQSAWGDEDLAISAMLAIASEAASPRKSERDAVLEEAACVAENMPYRVLCMWDRPGGPPGNGYAEIKGQKIIADRIRALKSTTPQTGSQE